MKPSELSPQEREVLDHLLQRKATPTKRQKAKALIFWNEGMTLERIAESTGISKDELGSLFESYTLSGLAGLGLAPDTNKAKEKRHLARHPRIKKTSGVCGGAARIDGTRIPIWQLVEERDLGASESQLLNDYRTLKARDLADAWDYAEKHLDEIKAEIRRNLVI